MIDAVANVPRPEFAGLGAFYTREIEPGLEAREGQRRRARLLRWLIIGGGFAGLVAWLYYMTVSSGEGFWFVVAIILGFIIVALGNLPVIRLKSDVKQFVMSKLAEYFGFAYGAEPDFPDFHLLRELLLVPLHDKRSFEDGLEGEIRGVKFRLVEARLTQRQKRGKNHRNVTVFHGLLLSMAHPTSGEDAIAVWREGAMGWLSTGTLREVSFRDPDFDGDYTVYSRDAAMAQRLLDDAARAAYRDLDRHESIDSARLGIAEGRLVMAFSTGTDSFEVGKLGRRLADPGRVQAMVEQFAILFDVVDAFGARAAAAPVMAHRR